MATITNTVNVSECDASCTPGTFLVRAYYSGAPDDGHLWGPFASREAAEKCAHNLALREGVIKAVIEEGN